ncbi:hypothetical protein [Cylindrospermopsis raciborskii]|uniref:hypothetical protein n=1 Tax=Cylindrospermopsis raciborskii TaxID=77022 RepID=UPI0015E867AC|nr:hypothetical protein [Cylindrospermopsis raciborskii]
MPRGERSPVGSAAQSHIGSVMRSPVGSAMRSPAEERVTPGDSQGKFHRTTVGVYHILRSPRL